MNKYLKLIICIVTPLAAGWIGSAFTVSAISEWYDTLLKPAVNPPSWLFAPVWTSLYLLMGIASYLIWTREGKSAQIRFALAVYSGQLVLNALWSIIFFGWRLPMIAFVELAVLWLAIAATIFSFARISRPAAYLLIPYIAWVSFAGYLNLSIALLN